MSINEADAPSELAFALDETENLIMCSDANLGQIRERGQNDATLTKPAECDLSDDEWMDQHASGIQEFAEPRVTPSQMINPD